MKKQRKHYKPEEKVAILRRHLLENEPISKLCDELTLKPTVLSAGRRSSSRTALLPSNRKRDRSIQPTRSGSLTWRRRSRPKTRFWPN